MQDRASAEKWDDVRVFLAAYRARSLGLAAARLKLDTSTLSRRIAAFEQQIGTRLFERSREGLLPTRSAEQIFAAAEAMETAHARLSRDASDVEQRAEGTVRLTVDPGIAEGFVVPALPRFRAEHPAVEIELDASPLPRDLARREADIAVRSTKVVGAELIATKLASASWLPLGSPELIADLGVLASWAAAPWVIWDRDMTGFPPAQWVARHAGKAPIPLKTSHFASQIVAAQSGLGLALLPSPYIKLRGLRQARANKALRDATQEWPKSEVWLVSHRVLRDVPRVAAVWNFLAREMRGFSD